MKKNIELCKLTINQINFNFVLLIFLALISLALTSCYTIKNENSLKKINLNIFKNDTNIFGLENELAQQLPQAFRKELGFHTGNSNYGYVVKGKLISYRKKVVRKATNGEPTHQQVTIEISFDFLENDKVLYSQNITNISYRIDSGLYNSSKGESEIFGRQNALTDISEAIAQNINYYFLEK
jgi:hypothetical protein